VAPFAPAIASVVAKSMATNFQTKRTPIQRGRGVTAPAKDETTKSGGSFLQALVAWCKAKLRRHKQMWPSLPCSAPRTAALATQDSRQGMEGDGDDSEEMLQESWLPAASTLNAAGADGGCRSLTSPWPGTIVGGLSEDKIEEKWWPGILRFWIYRLI